MTHPSSWWISSQLPFRSLCPARRPHPGPRGALCSCRTPHLSPCPLRSARLLAVRVDGVSGALSEGQAHQTHPQKLPAPGRGGRQPVSGGGGTRICGTTLYGPAGRHPTDLIHPLNCLDLSCELTTARRLGPAYHHLPRGSGKYLWTQAKGGQQTAPTLPWAQRPHLCEQPPLGPVVPGAGGNAGIRCLVGLRFKGRPTELLARKVGPPLSSPATGQEPRPAGRAEIVLPSRSSGGYRDWGTALPAAAAYRRARQLLSKRPSSVTRGQAFSASGTIFKHLTPRLTLRKRISHPNLTVQARKRGAPPLSCMPGPRPPDHTVTLPRASGTPSPTCCPAQPSPREDA